MTSEYWELHEAEGLAEQDMSLLWEEEEG